MRDLRTPRPPRGLSLSALRAATLALLGVTAATVAAYWIWHLTVPHAVEPVEGHMLALVRWWREGYSPWAGPDRLPLQQNVYGPVYERLAFHADTGLARPYLGGRLISVVAAVAIVAGAGVWTWRRTRSPWIALCVALLPLTAKPVLDFAPLYRVDTLGVLLSLVAFAVLVHARSAIGVTSGTALAALAFLTKGTMVAAPVAAVIVLWRRGPRQRPPRQALIVAAALAATFAVALAAMEWATGGRYLEALRWGMFPVHAPRSVDMVARTGLSIFWIAAIRALARARHGALASSPWAYYSVTALAVGAAAGAQPMSSWNYLLELYPALALLTGDLLAGSSTTEGSRLAARRAAAGVLAAAPAPGVSTDASPSPVEPGSRALRQAVTLLALHAAVSLPIAAVTIDRRLDRVAVHREALERSSRHLAALVAQGRRVAVVDDDPGRDALNLLGSPSWVNLPWRLSQDPEVRSFIESARARGEIDVVLWADDLAAVRAVEVPRR